MGFNFLCPHFTSYNHRVLSCDGIESLPSFAVLPNTSHVAAVRQYSCQYGYGHGTHVGVGRVWKQLPIISILYLVL